MKYLLFALFVLVGTHTFSQGFLQKVPVAQTGTYVYASGPVEFEKTYSEDSSAMYMGGFIRNDFYFEMIVVELPDMTGVGKEDLENLLISYLDYLKTHLGVKAAVGYGKGHTNLSSADAMGVIDYWSFDDGDEAKIKGWVNPKFLAVLYVRGKGEYPKLGEMDMFLDGFRFPQ